MTSPPTSGSPPARPGPDPDAAVARAMAGLDGLDERPLHEHVDVFERVHAALSDALTAEPPPAIG